MLPSVWFDFATGQPYTGGRMMKLWRALEEYPVFAPAGGIVPLADDLRADVLPGHLTLRIFAGADGSYELYEDDGISLNSSSVRTAISLDWQHGTLRVHSIGDLSLLPEERTWHVECIGFAPTAVIHQGEGISTTYDVSGTGGARKSSCVSPFNEPDGTQESHACAAATGAAVAAATTG